MRQSRSIWEVDRVVVGEVDDEAGEQERSLAMSARRLAAIEACCGDAVVCRCVGEFGCGRMCARACRQKRRAMTMGAWRGRREGWLSTKLTCEKLKEAILRDPATAAAAAAACTGATHSPVLCVFGED
jgi:hypothetical protein